AEVVDTFPPNLTVLEPALTDTTALIRWTTDEPANAAVDYGLTPGYELGTVTSDSFVFEHALTLSDLTPDTTYYIRMRSSDASDNEGQAEQTITTGTQGDS